MVVLEGGGMLTSGANQYLQPDYLSPLPTTLDAKKSPLALLAQTCSQIGADNPPKPLGLDKPVKKTSSSQRPASSERTQQSPARAEKRSSPAASAASAASASGSPATSPEQPAAKLAFKPYEANVLSRREDARPPSKSSSDAEERKSASLRKSSSPPSATGSATPTTSPSADRVKSTSPRSASPVIRSGLEVLHGHPKDLPLGTFKPGAHGLPANLMAQLCCPPGYEATHPAFRPPFAGASFSHQHAAALLASGYAPSGVPNPYFSYARVKTPTGSEALVPVCKDPYCTGCQFSMHSQLLMGAAAASASGVPTSTAASAAPGTPVCPAGCTQCEHQKYILPGLPPTFPVQQAQQQSSNGRPYVCSWIVSDNYCGKRFSSSDELLQHLRTHTSISGPLPPALLGSPTSMSSAVAAASAAAVAAAGYPSPRYHPYGKPTFPAGLGSSPFSAFNPAINPYHYSPYTLYGNRLGAAVHP